MKIYAFHLLNDYSGSPKVLMQLVKGWTKSGIDVTVVTCSGREGFLSHLDQVHYVEYWYRWAANPFLRLINLTLSQVIVVARLVTVIKKNDIVYINTVLPFGAAFLGMLKGCRIIYHIHETSMKPPLLKRFLFGVMKWSASDVIYVSKYLSEQEQVKNKRTHILYNAIEDTFLMESKKSVRPDRNPQHILMVCSLKSYKGVDEFFHLAQLHPALRFQLVVNASQKDIEGYIKEKQLAPNLTIFPVQQNLHPFYKWADIVVNLSHPDKWIETFGLTIIEGMAYGLPAIVPPAGGITEIVTDGENGYWADPRDLQFLSDRLRKLCTPEVYFPMRKKAAERMNTYREKLLMNQSFAILNS